MKKYYNTFKNTIIAIFAAVVVFGVTAYATDCNPNYVDGSGNWLVNSSCTFTASCKVPGNIIFDTGSASAPYSITLSNSTLGIDLGTKYVLFGSGAKGGKIILDSTSAIKGSGSLSWCSASTGCTVTNGTGSKSWDFTGSTWGSCNISCDSGYVQSGTGCVPATVPVNGSCGSSSGASLLDSSSITGASACSGGTLSGSTVSGSGPWTWSCNGANGGTNANCSANKAINYCAAGGTVPCFVSGSTTPPVVIAHGTPVTTITCDTPDITICAEGTGSACNPGTNRQVWQACNVGATKASEYTSCVDTDSCTTDRVGNYYTWAQAMSGATTDVSDVKGVCDVGYHLPHGGPTGNWQTAINIYPNQNLGNANNLATVLRLPSAGGYVGVTGVGKYGHYWSSTPYGPGGFSLYFGNVLGTDVLGDSSGYAGNTYKFSVRCIKDSAPATYNITTLVNGGGTVTGGGPGKSGTVNLTASPTSDYDFINWTGVNCIGGPNSNPCVFTATTDVTITANFSPKCLYASDIQIGSQYWKACNVGATDVGTGSSGNLYTYSQAIQPTTCGSGYHLPSKPEWDIAVSSYSGQNLWDTTNLATKLMLPLAGSNNGVYLPGINGVYWSSTANDLDVGSENVLYFKSNYLGLSGESISSKYSVRCIKDSLLVNCTAGSKTVGTNTYNVPQLNNSATGSVTYSTGVSNGTVTYTQGFICNAGAVNTNGSESSNTTCDPNYTWNGSSCAINTYTVTTATNSGTMGTVAGAGIYNFGSGVTLAGSANYGYFLNSWIGGPCNGIAISPTCTFSLTGNVSATGSFTAKLYTVGFESNGGSLTASQSLLYTNPVFKPADPIKAGYILVGWYTDSGTLANIAFISGKETVTSDITYYAKWTPASTTCDTPDITICTEGTGSACNPGTNRQVWQACNVGATKASQYASCINIASCTPEIIGTKFSWIGAMSGATADQLSGFDATSNVKGVCDPGYHLPHGDPITGDWKIAYNSYTGQIFGNIDNLATKLMLPKAGLGGLEIGIDGYYWSSNIFDVTKAYDQNFFNSQFTPGTYFNKTWLSSVRCIKDSFAISATTNSGSMGTVTGSGNYDSGATVTLTGTANTASGYAFSSWSGVTCNGGPNSNPCVFTDTGNVSGIMGNFIMKPIKSVADCGTTKGQIGYSTADGTDTNLTCSNDIIICNGTTGSGQAWAACNVGATSPLGYNIYVTGATQPAHDSISCISAYLPTNPNYNKDCNVAGKLFTWYDAMSGATANSGFNDPSNIQGVCANGYHLPHGNIDGDFQAAYISNNTNDTLGNIHNLATNLKLPLAGGRTSSPNTYWNQGTLGYYWSSSNYSISAGALSLYFNSSVLCPANSAGVNDRNYELSVRCIKN